MINYSEIIEELKDEDVFRLLEELGAEPINRNDYIICKTICHNEDIEEASQKLYYYKNSHMFYCYTEDGSMSIFKFLKNYYDTRGIIYDWFQDILEVIINCSTKKQYTSNYYKSLKENYTIKKARTNLPVYTNGVLNCFVKRYCPEWLNDNITKESMDKYNILYSISQNKIIIPHYNISGELVGIRGRALNKQDIETFGKYMPVQIENKWYSHPLSLNLYGLDKNYENIKRFGIAYIFESEKSVLQTDSFSMPNCSVASCGSNLNKFQVDLLIRYCHPREIVICYDREEKNGEDVYFNKLYKMCNKYKNYCNMSFIYDRNKITKEKDSPSDNGEEIFKKLLSERITIR